MTNRGIICLINCLINLLVSTKASYYLTIHGQAADGFPLMLSVFMNCFYNPQKLKLALFREYLKHLLLIYLMTIT